MIDPRTIEIIKETTQIEDVVQTSVSLKQQGSNLIGLCPFHSEKTPSFTVSPSKNLYKCFGCGKGGDAISFLMEHENLSYVESLRHLASLYGIKIEEKKLSADELEEYNKRESLYNLLETAKKYYKHQLWNTKAGKIIGQSYFKERGLVKKTLEKFEVGYAPDDRQGLIRYTRKMGISIDQLKEVGLASRQGYDFFFDRVMFPIHSPKGKIVGFAGRALSSKTKAKYINSPETPVYNKRKILFGLYQAKEAIRKADHCYIVEGYMDVLAMFQNNIENVTATSGTSLTADQIKLIRRYTKNLTFIFDSDQAGVNAALKGIDTALPENMNVQIVHLPKNDDPDSFLKENGRTEFIKYVEEKRQNFIAYKIKEILPEEKNDIISTSEATREVIHTLSKIPDIVKRNLFTREASKLLTVDFDVLQQSLEEVLFNRDKSERFKEIREQNKKRAGNLFKTEKELQETTFYIEKELVSALLEAGDKINKEYDITYTEYILANLEEIMIDRIEHPVCKAIISDARVIINRGEKPDLTYFIHHEAEDIRQFSIDLLSPKYAYAEGWDKKDFALQTQKKPEENHQENIRETLMRFKMAKLNNILEETYEEISEAEKNGRQMQAEKSYKLYTKLLKLRNDIADTMRTVTII